MTKKRGCDDLFGRRFVKNDIGGVQTPFGRFWGARKTRSLYMSSFDDATTSWAQRGQTPQALPGAATARGRHGTRRDSYHDDCDHARVLPAHGLQGAEARWRGRLKTGTL